MQHSNGSGAEEKIAAIDESIKGLRLNRQQLKMHPARLNSLLQSVPCAGYGPMHRKPAWQVQGNR